MNDNKFFLLHYNYYLITIIIIMTQRLANVIINLIITIPLNSNTFIQMKFVAPTWIAIWIKAAITNEHAASSIPTHMRCKGLHAEEKGTDFTKLKALREIKGYSN